MSWSNVKSGSLFIIVKEKCDSYPVYIKLDNNWCYRINYQGKIHINELILFPEEQENIHVLDF